MKKVHIILASVALAFISGCGSLTLPRNEDELAKSSYPSLNQKIDYDFISAYANLKKMSETCLTRPYDPTYGVAAELDRSKGVATVTHYVRTNGGIVSRVVISSTGQNSTNLVFTQGKVKAALRDMSSEDLQSIFNQRVNWSYGKVKEC